MDPMHPDNRSYPGTRVRKTLCYQGRFNGLFPVAESIYRIMN